MTTKVKTLKIDGRNIDVTLTDDGEFYARPEEFEQGVKADTLKGLETTLRAKLRRSKLRVTVEATRLITDSWHDKPIRLDPVIITGVHGRTDRLLIKNATTGETTTVRGYDDSSLLQRLTAEEATALHKLDKARRESKAAWEARIAELKIDGVKELEAATRLAERAQPAATQAAD